MQPQTPLETQAVDLIQEGVKHSGVEPVRTAVKMIRHLATQPERHAVRLVVDGLDDDDLVALVTEMATQLGPIREWPPEEAA